MPQIKTHPKHNLDSISIKNKEFYLNEVLLKLVSARINKKNNQKI
jgi:hypothetical protein